MGIMPSVDQLIQQNWISASFDPWRKGSQQASSVRMGRQLSPMPTVLSSAARFRENGRGENGSKSRGGFEASSSIIPGLEAGTLKWRVSILGYPWNLPQVDQNHLRCQIEGRNRSKTSEKPITMYKNHQPATIREYTLTYLDIPVAQWSQPNKPEATLALKMSRGIELKERSFGFQIKCIYRLSKQILANPGICLSIWSLQSHLSIHPSSIYLGIDLSCLSCLVLSYPVLSYPCLILSVLSISSNQIQSV